MSLSITNVLYADNILTPTQNMGKISLGRLMLAQLEGTFSEMRKGRPFGPDRSVRITRGKAS